MCGILLVRAVLVIWSHHCLLKARNTCLQCAAVSSRVPGPASVTLHSRNVWSVDKWCGRESRGSHSLSCQQKVMADLQLTLNHRLTTGAASATTAATDTNLRLWTGFSTQHRAEEVWSLSANQSPPPRLTPLAAKQNDFWSCRLPSAICLCRGCGLEIYFFTKRFMWVSTCHHGSFLLSAVCCHTAPSTRILCCKFSLACKQCWHWIRKLLVLRWPSQILAVVLGKG